jgi:hypothetical protein
VSPGNPLSGGQKTNVTSLETALNTAITSLSNPNDSTQAATLVVLRRMRRMLDAIKTERAQ